MPSKKIIDLLGDKASYLLEHKSNTIDKSTITLPSPNHIEEIWLNSNRNNQVLRSLQSLLGNGRLANTGFAASSRSTRASSTAEVPLSRPTQFISTLKILLNSPSKVVAMP